MLSFLNEDFTKVSVRLHLRTNVPINVHFGRLNKNLPSLSTIVTRKRIRTKCKSASHFTRFHFLTSRFPTRRVLTYLIPLRILRGHLPSSELLDRFPALDDLFAPFIKAVRTGDIRAYDAALDRCERRLVDLNLYLTLEKARELCIRGLFRKVCVFVRVLFGASFSDENHLPRVVLQVDRIC